jgi:hypothetical protein
MNKMMIIGGILFLILLSVGVYFMFFKEKTSETTSAPTSEEVIANNAMNYINENRPTKEEFDKWITDNEIDQTQWYQMLMNLFNNLNE